MTNEQMAKMILSDREQFKELIPVLWKNTGRCLIKMARNYYFSHTDFCTLRGAELSDITAVCYPAFLFALDSYQKEEEERPFISYFRFAFQEMIVRSLDFNTKRGKFDPIHSAESFDKEEEDHSAKSEGRPSLKESIADTELPIEVVVENKFESKLIREAIDDLPDTRKKMIVYYFFYGMNYKDAGKKLGIKAEMARVILNSALVFLKNDPRIEGIYNQRRPHHDIPEDNRAADLKEWAERERLRRRNANTL